MLSTSHAPTAPFGAFALHAPLRYEHSDGPQGMAVAAYRRRSAAGHAHVSLMRRVLRWRVRRVVVAPS
jgi:hypothetical protein